MLPPSASVEIMVVYYIQNLLVLAQTDHRFVLSFLFLTVPSHYSSVEGILEGVGHNIVTHFLAGFGPQYEFFSYVVCLEI